MTATFAKKFYLTDSHNSLRNVRGLVIKKYGASVMNFERYKQPPVTKKLKGYPNRINGHLTIRGWW